MLFVLNDGRGSVKPYARHLLISTGSGMHAQWPEKIDEGADAVSQWFQALNDALKDSTVGRTLVSATDADPVPSTNTAHSGNDTGDVAMDVWALPHMRIFPGVTANDLSALVADLDAESSTRQSLPIQQQGQDVSHVVLVCSHLKRDKRCGVIGPMLCNQFHQELQERGIRQRVCILQVSHIGGILYFNLNKVINLRET